MESWPLPLECWDCRNCIQLNKDAVNSQVSFWHWVGVNSGGDWSFMMHHTTNAARNNSGSLFIFPLSFDCLLCVNKPFTVYLIFHNSHISFRSTNGRLIFKKMRVWRVCKMCNKETQKWRMALVLNFPVSSCLLGDLNFPVALGDSIATPPPSPSNLPCWDGYLLFTI